MDEASVENCETNDDKGRPILQDWERDAVVRSVEKCLDEATLFVRRNDSLDTTTPKFLPNGVNYSELTNSRTLYAGEERAVEDVETKAVFQKLKNDRFVSASLAMISRLAKTTFSDFVTNVFLDLLRELRSSGSFSGLAAIRRAEDSSSVAKHARDNLEAAKRLREIVSNERRANEIEAKHCWEKLSMAKRESECRLSQGGISFAYVSVWEETRIEQNVIRCRIAEEESLRRLELLGAKMENEKRVDANIRAFLSHDIAENEIEIAEWNNRHGRESVRYSREIEVLRGRIESESKVLERLKEEERVKRGFVDDYLAEKEADRREKVREEEVRTSTMKIQAWWRGVMVRLKLGRYRPEDKMKKKRPAKSKK